MSLWRKRPAMKAEHPWTTKELERLDREREARLWAAVLDTSKDATRHKRADEITNGRFSKALEKQK